MRRFNPNTVTHAEFYRVMFGQNVVTPAMREAAQDALDPESLEAEQKSIRADLEAAGIGSVEETLVDEWGEPLAA